MRFGIRTRLLGVVTVVALTASLSGCDTFRKATGSDKQSPDEFEVVTKAPLIIPPDFNLKPPKPGAPPTNQVSPTEAAQAALYNTDPATTAAAMPGNMSTGEKLLLAYAGAATADSSIRQIIAADSRNMQATDESFTDGLMFWQKSAPATDPAVDADAEARRMQTQTPAAKPASDPNIQKDNGAGNDH